MKTVNLLLRIKDQMAVYAKMVCNGALFKKHMPGY